MCHICETDSLPIEMYLNEEKKQLDNYCRDNGLYYRLNSEKGTLDVISKSGKWKIIVNGTENQIWLYHKNNYGTKSGDLIPGYHYQKIRSNNLMGYMEYIVNHDKYRDEKPLYEYQIDSKTVKGSKRWKKNQKLAKNMRKARSVRYVKAIMDNIALDNTEQ